MKAFVRLNRAVDEHSAPPSKALDRADYIPGAFARDPRFAEVLRRINLDPAKVLAPR